MSYAKDLREKAIKYVEQGGLIKEACKVFEISRSSFQRWRVRQANTGTVSAKARARKPYKIKPEELKRYVSQHPDAYLNEIASHFNVTSPCILIALRRLNITPGLTKNSLQPMDFLVH